MSYLTISLERLDENSSRVSIVDIHQEVISFMNLRRNFRIKGITFKANDNQLLFKSSPGLLIGKIEGLSGISPKKSVIIRANKSLIPKIEQSIFLALQELVYVIKMCKHGPGIDNYASYFISQGNTEITKSLVEGDVNRLIGKSR